MVDKYTTPKNPIVYKSDKPSANIGAPPSFESGNNASQRMYIGPDFPPQAYPQGSHEGSQSVSPPKDNY